MSKLQIPLKVNKDKDGIIYDVLSLCDDRTNFIKNAIFYYITHIETGTVIDRTYPYNKVNIKLDVISENYAKNTNKLFTENNTEEEYIEVDKLIDENDNMDDMDI